MADAKKYRASVKSVGDKHREIHKSKNSTYARLDDAVCEPESTNGSASGKYPIDESKQDAARSTQIVSVVFGGAHLTGSPPVLDTSLSSPSNTAPT